MRITLSTEPGNVERTGLATTIEGMANPRWNIPPTHALAPGSVFAVINGKHRLGDNFFYRVSPSFNDSGSASGIIS